MVREPDGLVIDRLDALVAMPERVFQVLGKNSDRSGFVGSAILQRKTDRAHGLRTSPAYESKACRLAVAMQRLAGNYL
jgi:hypothetical protein